MKCIAPIWIQETSDTAGTYVPCGRCFNCIQTKRSVWTFRILQELETAENGYFITLTYKPETVPLIRQYNAFNVMNLCREDLTLFLKALRSQIKRDKTLSKQWYKQSEKTKKWSPKLRYFATGEYGYKTERPHYHLILFNLPNKYIQKHPVTKELISTKLESIWKLGKIDIGKVERASAHYMTKHHMFPNAQRNKSDAREKPFSTMSRKPGIGYNYTQDGQIKNYYLNTTNSYATLKNGIKTPLGRYLKNKIFEEGQEQNAARLQTAEYIREQEQREADYYIQKQQGDIEAAYRDQITAEKANIAAGLKKFKRNQIKNHKL